MSESKPLKILLNPTAKPTIALSSSPDSSSDSLIQAFHSSLPSYKPTPLISLPALASSLNLHALHLKSEVSRLTLPSFKILGASWGAFRALNAHLSLPPSTPLAGLQQQIAAHSATLHLYAATDGNHGRALAYTARLLGASAIIYVPHTLDAVACAPIEAEGATLRRSTGSYDRTVRDAAAAAAADPNGVLVQDTSWPGYETVPAWIVEGYGTLLREIDAQLGARPDIVVTPVGVGSLAQAVVSHYKGQTAGAVAEVRQGSEVEDKATWIVAVEPATAACLHASLAAGEATPVDTPGTIMTGMDCGTVSYAAWPLLQQGIDAAVMVTDAEAHRAVKELRREGVPAGPCGAAALAAVRRLCEEQPLGKEGLQSKTVVILCTEGEREYVVPEGH